jgi:hypothetical protein
MVVLGQLPRFRFAACLLGVFAFTLVAFGGPGTAAARTVHATEYRVKAAFVYKFGDYVEWPSDAFATPNSPLVIGVVGADTLADELARIAVGRTIGSRPVAVRKLKHGAPLSGLHVIFIGQSDSRKLAAELDASKGQPALTVTESADGLKLGSMINFVVVSDKVRFDVAVPSAEASRLKISSRLLAVARNVVASPP